MATWFKHEIAAWRRGTSSMTPEQYRVYHVIIEQIMMDEGPTPIHLRSLAGLSGMGVRAFQRVLNELIELGKLYKVGDRITNERAEQELSSFGANRKNGKTGGIISGKTRRKQAELRSATNENDNDSNGDDEATLQDAGNHIREDSDSEPDKDKSKKEARERADADGWPDNGFDLFWEKFPNKIGKSAARDSYDKLRRESRTNPKKRHFCTFDKLMEGLELYLNKDDFRDWCHPTTFLNQDRWTDRPAQKPTGAAGYKAARRVAI
jgi:uncharacterized protein YdaU (DUF1376 family)